MAVTYGFYNSLEGDRKYDAIQMSRLFDGLIKDGIYASEGTNFIVRSKDAGLAIIVGEGRCWFNHTWTLNDSEIEFTLDPANVMYPRIDAVIIEVDQADNIRANSIKVLKGVAAPVAVRPTVVNTVNGTLHQYAVCYVSIPANLATLSASYITNMVGSGDVPFVTGVLQSFNVDVLLTQWRSQWNDWSNEWLAWFMDKNLTFSGWFQGLENQWGNLLDAKEEEFDTWFGGLETQWTDLLSAKATIFTNWFNGLDSQWTALLDDKANVFATWFGGLGDQWTNLLSSKANSFDSWFANIQDQLSTDAAGNLQLEIDAMREILTANRTYYVRVDGNDTNTGLADTAGAAFRYMQKAIDAACKLDMRSYNVTIHVGDGAQGSILLKPFLGTGTITITGNTAAPENVPIAVVSQCCIKSYGVGAGPYVIQGMKLSSYSNSAVDIGDNCKLTIHDVDFGACGIHHVHVTNGASLYLSNYKISGYCDIAHCYVENNSYAMIYGTVTIATNPIVIDAFLSVIKNSIAYLPGVNFVNRTYATGLQYIVKTNGVIDTAGAGADYLPGTSHTVESGGQYV